MTEASVTPSDPTAIWVVSKAKDSGSLSSKPGPHGRQIPEKREGARTARGRGGEGLGATAHPAYHVQLGGQAHWLIGVEPETQVLTGRRERCPRRRWPGLRPRPAAPRRRRRRAPAIPGCAACAAGMGGPCRRAGWNASMAGSQASNPAGATKSIRASRIAGSADWPGRGVVGSIRSGASRGRTSVTHSVKMRSRASSAVSAGSRRKGWGGERKDREPWQVERSGLVERAHESGDRVLVRLCR